MIMRRRNSNPRLHGLHNQFPGLVEHARPSHWMRQGNLPLSDCHGSHRIQHQGNLALPRVPLYSAVAKTCSSSGNQVIPSHGAEQKVDLPWRFSSVCMCDGGNPFRMRNLAWVYLVIRRTKEEHAPAPQSTEPLGNKEWLNQRAFVPFWVHAC